MKRSLLILFLLTLGVRNSPSAIATLPDPVPDQDMTVSQNGLSLVICKTILLSD